MKYEDEKRMRYAENLFSIAVDQMITSARKSRAEDTFGLCLESNL